MPNKMEEIAIENLRRSWAEAHGGENQFKVAVLEEGVTFSKIAATPEEGQMLETRSYQREEITSLFGVPLHMLVQSKGSGKSNVEQAAIEFFQFCLNPWIVQWTQELERKLFPKMGRSANRYVPHFETRQLLYPDSASRGAYYANGIQWGWLNGNDIHEFEGLNPIEDGTGDLYRVQVNMQPADMPMTGGPGMEDHLTLQNKLMPPTAPSAPPAGNTNKPGKPGKKPSQGKAKGKNKGKRSLGTGGDTPMFIMRHGTTDADVFRGWSDCKLDEQGIAEAERTAAMLKDKGIKHIVTSTLARHQQTAGIVSRILGNVPVEHDDDFRTLNVGVYTGKKRSEYADEIEWYLEHTEAEIPGGEAVTDFNDRNTRAFAKIRALNELGGATLVITSRSNIAALETAGVTGEFADTDGVYQLDGGDDLELLGTVQS
jgi:broad specificity phosphatase PhoE